MKRISLTIILFSLVIVLLGCQKKSELAEPNALDKTQNSDTPNPPEQRAGADDQPAAQEESKMDAEANKEPETIGRIDLPTYPVNIQASGADAIYVNGQHIIDGKYQFVRGRRNTVMAFANGMTPYFRTFEKDEEVSAVEIKLETAALYPKGSLEFRCPACSSDVRAALDGRVLDTFPGPVRDVVLGFPHILEIEKPGLEKHLHIVWPDDPKTSVSNTVVTIPEFEEGPLYHTKCSLRKFPSSAKPYGVRIETTDQRFDKPVAATVRPGDMIQFYITREQRKPLKFSVIPDGFGTLQLDTTLMYESLYVTVVKFHNLNKGSKLKLCLRRTGELICPEMEKDVEIPSGPNWEIIGFTGEVSSPSKVDGSLFVNLPANRRVVYEYSLNSDNSLTVKAVENQMIKKGKK